MMIQRFLVWVTSYVSLFTEIRSKKKKKKLSGERMSLYSLNLSFAVDSLSGRLNCGYKTGVQQQKTKVKY